MLAAVSYATVAVRGEFVVAAASFSRRITEIGLLLGFVGALLVGWGAFRVIRGSFERERERMATLLGVALIGLAFVLQLLGVLTVSKNRPSPSPSVSPTGLTGSPATKSPKSP
jgi:Zn-dependent protease with chaperone function